jgi:hypothetical protein
MRNVFRVQSCLVGGILNTMQCIGSADLNSDEFAPLFEKDMQS